MDKPTYVTLLQDLLSRDPKRVRDANRRLYAAVVQEDGDCDTLDDPLCADIALAAVAGPVRTT